MKNADKPAMGQSVRTSPNHTHIFVGLTKRELACIKLRIPKSGDDELDALIIEARRHDDAAKVMQGLLAKDVHNQSKLDMLTELSVTIADALLKRLDNA